MSCEVKFYAVLEDLEKVKRILFSSKESSSEEENESWSDVNSWNWTTDWEEKGQIENENISEWMSLVIIAISPQFENLILAYQDRCVVMSSKWAKRKNKDDLVFSLSHPLSKLSKGIGDNITSVCCLPIKSLQKSSSGMADWMCIILGFSSGYIRMYTVGGDLLMTEIFQDEPVCHLKFQNPALGVNMTNQDFYVLYKKTIVIVEGTGLMNSLRVSRSCAAKGSSFYGINEVLTEHPPLHYRKLSLQEQTKINESFLFGTSSASQFDHFTTASIAGGFQARYNSCPPVSTGILSVGSHPYCAWHYFIEGSATPLLSDVAYALASKVTSKIVSKTSGWLGWGGGGSTKVENEFLKTKEKQIVEPASPVYPKYEISDSLREALSVSVSPNERLAAVTDSLGRVTLVDLSRGSALHMWKGYRDAQCGWMSSEEICHSDKCTWDESSFRRTVAFLVIYISKRGILEIWTPLQGVRVAAINCSKWAKLFTFSSFSDKNHQKCYLLCPDGMIYEILVPFHCALKGDSSQKARDFHFLQLLKNAVLKNGVTAPTLNILLEIRHVSVVNQGLDMILECRDLTDSDSIVEFLDRMITQYSKPDALDTESRLLLSRCQLLSRLVHFYIQMNTVEKEPVKSDDAVSQGFDICLQDVAATLNLSAEDVLRTIHNFSGNFRSSFRISQSFLDIYTYFSSFELAISHGNVGYHIRVKTSYEERSYKALESWLWGTAFLRNLNELDNLTPTLKDSSIPVQDLMLMLVSFWLQQRPEALPYILHFHKLLRILFDLTEEYPSTDSSNPLWQKFHDLLCKSNQLEQANSAALVIRSIMAEFDKQKVSCYKRIHPDINVNESMNEWEDMSSDIVKWNVLSKQLEDLSCLARLVKYVPLNLRKEQSQLIGFPLNENQDELLFSLSSVLQKGRGAVTELIGRWVTQNLLEVNALFEIQGDMETSNLSVSSDKDSGSDVNKATIGSCEESSIIQELFHELENHLPMSTQRDVVALSVAVEYAAMWAKDPKHLKLLERSCKAVMPLRSNMLRHGICRTLWSISLSPTFKELAIVMDKTGRLPRNFISRKINLPTPDLAIPFLELTMGLLDATISSAMSVESEPPLLIRYDDIWPTCEGATPIVEVAARQRLINIDLVLLHHQLAQTLYLIACLEIKGAHAFSLFDQRLVKNAFFHEFHTYPALPLQDIDSTVILNRLEFLKQVVCKAVEHMGHNQKLGLEFVGQAIKLGYEWNVDVDELRIKCIELLYMSRMDHLAQEILPSIHASDRLASTLVTIAGRRLKALLQPKHISALSPITTEWLNGFSTISYDSVQDLELEYEKTIALLVQCLSRIPSDCNDQFIANELHIFLSSLKTS